MNTESEREDNGTMTTTFLGQTVCIDPHHGHGSLAEGIDCATAQAAPDFWLDPTVNGESTATRRTS